MGSDCGVLDVLPAAAPDGALFRRANTSSWCASTVRDDAGVWHAYVSVFADHCGLNSWQANSQLVHAVSAGGPAGPFVNDTVIRLPFSHNPKVARDPVSREYLLFHIGCGDNQTRRYGPCAGGVTPLPPPPPAVRFTTPGGGCLAPANGTFPAWVSPQGRPVSPLVLATGAICADAASGWLVDHVDNRWYAAAWPTAQAFIDCGACVAGNPATLIGPPGHQRVAGGGGATSFLFNKSAGTIQIAGCDGMCLSNGAPGARAPCGAPGQPWAAAQLHAVPCGSAQARGWAEDRAADGGGGGGGGGAPPPTCGGEFTEVLSAPTPEGPWAFQTAFGPRAAGAWPASTDNPAPLFWPNGSLAVMFRAYAPYNSTIGISRAPGWRGPWALPEAPLFPGRAEDPFLWYQRSTNSYHALLHGLGGCGAGAAGVGCHAFSADGARWTLGSAPAYNFTVRFSDGSNTTFRRRERPHLVLDPDTGAPTHLINGVQPPQGLQPAGGQGDYAYTIVVPLRTCKCVHHRRGAPVRLGSQSRRLARAGVCRARRWVNLIFFLLRCCHCHRHRRRRWKLPAVARCAARRHIHNFSEPRAPPAPARTSHGSVCAARVVA
jgi:hypothetical protein